MATPGKTSNNVQRARKLTPLKEVLARIESEVGPVPERDVATGSAAGRVLARGIVPDKMSPWARYAVRDGYAVKSEATADASSYTPVLLNGGVLLVELGDQLPRDTDAVAPLDTILFDTDGAHALTAVASGEGTFAAGADASAGKAFMRAGRLLRPSDTTLLAGIHIEQVTVRAPRVRIVALSDDARHKSIAAFLARLIDATGGDPSMVERSGNDEGDDDDSLFNAEGADLIVMVGAGGSSSAGRFVTALARVGRVVTQGIGITPGETSTFGLVGRTPVLLVIGRIDAALASWTLVGEPALACLTGRTSQALTISAALQRKVTSTIGLVEMVPVQLQQSGAMPLASGYVPLQLLAQADGYLFVPAESEGFAAGTTVAVRLLP
jgi:molybdopterin molybdotransferase